MIRCSDDLNLSLLQAGNISPIYVHVCHQSLLTWTCIHQFPFLRFHLQSTNFILVYNGHTAHVCIPSPSTSSTKLSEQMQQQEHLLMKAHGFSLLDKHIQMQSHTNTHKGSTCTQMKRGILEVLLVHAKGMKHTNLIGPPVYHVIIQCGSHVHKSKASSGEDEKTWWNEKFRFDFPLADWKQLTHLKFRIMDQEFFTDGGFVGETIIYLGGIIDEGINRGVLEMMPAPYNVLLEDDTYKGEIKIGLKFIANTEVLPERTFLAKVNEPRQPICRSIINLWKLSWWKLWIYHSQRSTKNKTEEE